MGAPTPHDLAAALAGVADVTALGAGGVQARVAADDIPAVAMRLATLGGEIQLLAGADTRAATGDFTLTYVFAPPGGGPVATVLASVPASAPRFPSLATRSFAASRFEREVHDLLGLVPVGHPDPRRLALHQFWPEGYHPLRRDVAARTVFFDVGRPFPFRHVEVEGVFEITVGPVHAGIIEPGHFRFSVEGETVVSLETRLGWVHKGVEKLFETLPFARTWALAERISGDESVAHALAYCQALETLAAGQVPRRAAWLRVVLAELERLYNHVGDVGMIVNDTGFAFGHAHCFRLREELLRLNERFAGHRLLRGAVVPGGVAPRLAEMSLGDVARRVTALVREFLEVAALSLDNTMVLDRLQGTGRLTARTAREMQVVGLVARASGLDADARRDAPAGAYHDLDVRVATRETGDVWARTMVRIDEITEAARLIEIAATRVNGGATAAPFGPLRAGAHATSVVEAWRGPIWYWVRAGDEASVARVKVADPSFRNWPALEYAVLENIVPDFPLCNKSFNLSYSGNDL
ncbi:MAG: NADH-quinone oxidoreductase subunit C [Candidatus Rokubacteria bacterium]|nr:NADH-quinone oxidoreductase subunit C [Candidatus Rokubacteria bacterium]